MSSRLSGRQSCLLAGMVVFTVLCSLFTVSPAQAAGTSISGKVTKPSGSALGGSTVDLYSVDDEGYWFEREVKTRSDGTYSFTSVPRGTYVVGFGALSKTYAAEYWSNVKEIQDAREIRLGSSAVSGVNARLAVGGTVRGWVTAEEDNHGVADAQVIAYRYDSGGWTFDKDVDTASDGSFAVTGLTEGQFMLEFNPPVVGGTDDDLALEYWDNNRVFGTEDLFQVRLGETVTGKNAALSPGGRISGKVTGPDGEPVADAPVFGYPSDNPDELGNIAFTAEDGTYEMTGLSEGQHRLEFYGPFDLAPGYAPEWWDDHSSFDLAEPITVVARETTAGKDAQLAAEGTPVVNTKRPIITGTPQVGETLTADQGSWSSEPTEFDYQWFADGSPIADTNRETFTIGSSQVGKTISVDVTASRPGYESGTAASASTDPVVAGTFTNKEQPVIDNATRVGDHFRVLGGTWNMPSPERSYQLIIDGVDVPGATEQHHDVTPDMIGKRLSFREEVSLPGFSPASATTEQSAPILEGQLTPTTKPSFDGDAIVGEPITADPGTWDQSGQTDATLTFGYKWLADGTEIAGAESAKFTPTASHAGQALTVEVTASRPGYTTATSVSDPATVNESGALPITQGANGPSITGNPSVGTTLTAQPGDWKPEPSSFAYQWLADGDAIDGAIGSTFRPSAAEAGKHISVTVTASRSGYAPGRATSAETVPVVTSTPFGAPRNLESTKTTVTSISLAWTKVDGAAKYRISYGIGTGTRTSVEVGNVTTAKLKGLKPGRTYSISIAAIKSNGTRSSYSPRIDVRTVSLVPPSELTVTGQTRTSLTLTWTKVAGVPKYGLYYGIGSGTRTKVEVGDVDTTTITGLKPGTGYSIDIASVLADGTRSSYSPRIVGTTAD